MNRKLPCLGISAVAVIVLIIALHVCACAETIRVGLTCYGSKTVQLSMSATSPVSIIRIDNNEKLAASAQSIMLESGTLDIMLKPDALEAIAAGTALTIAPDDPSAVMTITSPITRNRKYRGALEVTLKSGSLRVVNIVDVDDYLLGVLPAEMGNAFPIEALKAQAITARTYALANHRKHSSQGFDVCDSTDCQTYGGVSAEKSRCSQAVLDTRGMIVMFDGRPAEVMYSTDCGGATANYCEVRPNSNFPYLCGVTDPDDIQRICWEQSYALQDLGSKLSAAGVKEAVNMQSISVTKTGISGRVLEIEVAGVGAKTVVTGDKMRRALGLKSTLFTIETDAEGKLVIKGKGFGHGVGLCQTGAKGLATEPHNFTCSQILSHYFPGTTISGAQSSQPATAAAATTTIQSQTINVAAIPASEGSGKTDQSKPPVKPASKPSTFDLRLHVPDRL